MYCVAGTLYRYSNGNLKHICFFSGLSRCGKRLQAVRTPVHEALLTMLKLKYEKHTACLHSKVLLINFSSAAPAWPGDVPTLRRCAATLNTHLVRYDVHLQSLIRNCFLFVIFRQ